MKLTDAEAKSKREQNRKCRLKHPYLSWVCDPDMRQTGRGKGHFTVLNIRNRHNTKNIFQSRRGYKIHYEDHYILGELK